MMDRAAFEAIIDRYCAAWCEPDAAKRDAILAPVWGEGATYTDPTVHVVGRAALVAHIDAVFKVYPGATIVRVSSVDVHHAVARFAWKMVLADGTSLPEGIDLAEVAGYGKLARIVGFFGPLASTAR
jgi:hypothetical protein